MRYSDHERESMRPGDAQGESDRGRELGSLIGAVFGLVFVVVNSGGSAPGARAAMLAVATAALVVVLALGVRSLRRRRPSAATPDRHRGSPFPRAYWVVVAIEAVALFAGARLLTAAGHPELGVAWVSVVVGTHFFALARLFGLRRFHLLAILVTLCGLAGIVLALVGGAAAIPLVSGVLSGFVLLGFALWAMLARPSDPAAGRSVAGQPGG